MTKEGYTAVYFDFKNSALINLDKMVTETGAKDRAEVIQNALQDYHSKIETRKLPFFKRLLFKINVSY